MTPERWQQIKRLFHSALEQGVDERADFLARACPSDESLRREVESLLASHDLGESFIEQPAADVAAELLADRASALEAGRRIGHYEIKSLLGAGGMGEVYLAEDMRLGRPVALKLLPAQFTADAERVRRFEQEACAASALNHPNIITIHEIGRADGFYFMATEFIDGETLRSRMDSAPMAVGELLDVAAQVAAALAAAHEVGVVHRDIKPDNIMLRADGYVKVLDFGLAKLTMPRTLAARPEAPPIEVKTQAGMVLGTISYMSPEQARGLPVDERSDIWSLGVVLYELVAGRAPFEGETPSHVTVSILEGEPPPLAHYAEVPAELEHIVRKALHKDRAERYQRAGDLARELKSLQQDLEVEARLKGALRERAGDTSAAMAVRGSAASPVDAVRTHAPSSALSIAREVKRHKAGVAFTVAAIMIAAVVYFIYFANRGEAIDSVAVLPFVNASNDPNAEYLSDGVTESIISNLSQASQLRVMARATVFRFKGQEIDPKEVGRKLNVKALLMGRLLQQGERLIIRVELVRAADGTQLWGAEYNRQRADALSIQQEIAQEISERLRLRLTGEERRQLTGRDTTNPGAYQSYLRGRYYWNKRTSDGLRKAIVEFQDAIERDPAYALGYVGLADCYALLEEYAGTPSSETLPKARAAADRALQIDDSLAEAHAASGNIYMRMWRWAEAEEEFKRAISLNPNDPMAHHWFSFYLRNMRQYDDALREIKRAQELDPLSLVLNNNVAISYYMNGDIDSAIEQDQRTIELDPSFPAAHRTLGFYYLKRRRYEEAIIEIQKAVALSGRDSVTLGNLGYCYAVTGKRAEARQILQELEGRYAKHESPGQYLAEVYVGLGEEDQAFTWLEKDFEQRSGRLPNISYKYTFDDLRSDPRYADLLRRMGLQP